MDSSAKKMRFVRTLLKQISFFQDKTKPKFEKFNSDSVKWIIQPKIFVWFVLNTDSQLKFDILIFSTNRQTIKTIQLSFIDFTGVNYDYCRQLL